ncbi:tRNA lysidine(34) synthetase TilS [Nitratifractor sp.]
MSNEKFPLLESVRLYEKPLLLAFSHGLDSTALFHLMREGGSAPDLAMVHYGRRPEADGELAAARELADRYGVRIFVAHAPKWISDFEAQARRFRYRFFEDLIDEHGYQTLLTAHQLEDRFEWMMMRLARGAGAVELAGMEAASLRRTSRGREYRLLRPLLEYSRSQLRAYLDSRGYRYFLDASNDDGSNERSRLRQELGGFARKYREGILRSFHYLEADRECLRRGWSLILRRDELRVYRYGAACDAVRAADEGLKELGYLLSGDERHRIERGESLVAGRRWAVERGEGLLYLAPYRRGVVMPRRYRERCRHSRIPAKIRPYCYEEGIEPESLSSI